MLNLDGQGHIMRCWVNKCMKACRIIQVHIRYVGPYKQTHYYHSGQTCQVVHP